MFLSRDIPPDGAFLLCSRFLASQDQTLRASVSRNEPTVPGTRIIAEPQRHWRQILKYDLSVLYDGRSGIE